MAPTLSPHNPVLIPSSWLNHYQIIRQIGAGGMGEVYEAEDTRLKLNPDAITSFCANSMTRARRSI